MTGKTSREDALLKECACFDLRRASRAVTQLYDTYLAPSGLKTTQLTLLMVVRDGPFNISRLAEEMLMDRSSVTRMLGPLERRWLVAVAAGEDDRRTRSVRLTDEGRRLVGRALPHWREAQKALFRMLGEDRWLGLRGMLRETVAAVEESA